MLINNLNWIANYLGFLSLLGCLLVFTSAIAITLNNKHTNKKLLLRTAKWGVIITIFAGLSHGMLTTQRENINYYDVKTYWAYAEGLLTFNLSIYLVLNFNEIKLDFKRFIYFVYALLFLVVAHLSGTVIYQG